MIPEATPLIDTTLRAVLSDILGIDRARVDAFTAMTPLFGSLPELDVRRCCGSGRTPAR